MRSLGQQSRIDEAVQYRVTVPKKSVANCKREIHGQIDRDIASIRKKKRISQQPTVYLYHRLHCASPAGRITAANANDTCVAAHSDPKLRLRLIDFV